MNKQLILLVIIANCISAKSQFKGGVGDGFSGIPTYSQQFIGVFSGGQNDGFATASYNQVGAPLPINLLNFSGKKVGETNQLNWQTSNEINASHFEIERSVNDKEFEKIGEVKATNKIFAETYEYQDRTPLLGRSDVSAGGLYRLKLVDLDGKFGYSKIIYLKNTDNEVIISNFYPNPAVENKANIDINNDEKTEWIFSTVDISGKIIKSEKRVLEKGLNTLQFENFQKGMNIIQFESNGKVIVRKLLR